MPTTRETFERKVAELTALADACDQKPRLSDDDRRNLDDLGRQVVAFGSLLKGQATDAQLRGDQGPAAELARLAGSSAKPAGAWSSAGVSGGFAHDGGGPVAKDRLADFAFSEPDLKSLQSSALRRETKATISSTTAPMSAVADYRIETVFPWLRDSTRVLDHIPKETTEAPEVHYFRALTAAASAATVAQGTAKPESTPTWSEVTATVRKIAHYSRVNDEVLADFRAFLDVIGTEMIAGIIDKENQQLISGDGTGTNLLGIMADPAVQTVPSAGTDLDAVAAAFAALRTGAAHCDPDAILMHPSDWFSSGFLTAKETTGAYLMGNPVSAVKPALWGVPVLVSEYVTENTAIVANLKIACTAYIRQAPTFEVAPYGGGSAEFIANQTLVRAEERLALAIHHPKAICLVTAV